MEKIKRNFGFGCMRLPMQGEEVDLAQTKQMVDAFLAQGFNYFDTAHGYIGGRSETALRTCLTSRYPRESYVLTDKLSGGFFETEADIRPFFARQLAACGVDYFDFYLMHSQNAENFQQFKACRAYETAFDLKAEGKIRHVGLSFHDRAEVLDRILTEYPQIEVVQIQFNYLDYDDIAVQSRKCYEVCRRHNKPVLVMEPVKGGTLAKLPERVETMFHEHSPAASNASWAIRFAASCPEVFMVLSGMSDMQQMLDNTSYMQDFKPLDDEERAIIKSAVDIINGTITVPCTGCSYCTDGCPMNIAIPKYFSLYNADKQESAEKGWSSHGEYYYNLTKNFGKASDCIGCGQCESVCPQHLPIRKYLKDVAEHFESEQA